ncbi:beta family protein [Streptomyces sp. NPDC047117]|uniref:beta family protein n=1 Tax=unclassified Streptomyces TaxID=2593676 RepID=UPI0033D26126
MAYVPILKGKKGEFLALKHASAEVRSRIRPVMELVPHPGARDLLTIFCDQAVESVPKGMVLTVDCGALPMPSARQSNVSGGPMTRVGESLGQGQVAMCPVFRITDTGEQLDEVAAVMAWHEQGGCLRIPSADLSRDLADGERFRELLAALQAEPGEIDLVIDAGSVRSEDRRHALAGEITQALEWLAEWPWRRVCVAAGAFPVNLTGFPRGRATPVKREDALLWEQVAETWNGGALDFADYGVTHPRMPVQSRGAPHPNLRYTVDTDWQVFVYAKVRPGNDDFFVLSRDLVESPYWPSTGGATSWGDARVLECAQRQRAKAGGGTEWRAWATSHHLAVVTSRLAATGRP